VIDLAVVYGVPSFDVVLRAVAEVVVVEAATVALEIDAANEPCARLIEDLLDAPVERIPHDALKQRTARAVAVVRTGEATPYANVVLRCGVPFGGPPG
jgi:D-ribose pyranase